MASKSDRRCLSALSARYISKSVLPWTSSSLNPIISDNAEFMVIYLPSLSLWKTYCGMVFNNMRYFKLTGFQFAPCLFFLGDVNCINIHVLRLGYRKDTEQESFLPDFHTPFNALHFYRELRQPKYRSVRRLLSPTFIFNMSIRNSGGGISKQKGGILANPHDDIGIFQGKLRQFADRFFSQAPFADISPNDTHRPFCSIDQYPG